MVQKKIHIGLKYSIFRTKHKFYNPIRQNYTHQKAIEKYIGVSEESIVPIVVFSNQCKLSKIYNSRDTVVLEVSDAMKYVKMAEGNRHVTLSVLDIEKYLR